MRSSAACAAAPDRDSSPGSQHKAARAIRRPLRRTPFSWQEGDPIAQNSLRQTAAASVEKKNPTGWRNTKFSFECKSNLGG
jgi:hypothetical protein